MSNFLEKLKKGMGIEGEQADSPAVKRIRKKRPEIKILTPSFMPAPAPEPEEKIVKEEPKEQWAAFDEPAGQLAIDVYQTENDLVIQSAIAGIRADNLEISIERDVISIKGVREKPFEEQGDYFTKECYWGTFAREIIVPVEVDPDRAQAVMKEGILTIRIPKIQREKKRRIAVKI